MAEAAPERRLADVCSKLFLFLTTFRRTARQVDTDADWLRKRLVAIFEEQAASVAGDADLQRLYEKAQYPLVALADEVALNAEWKGREQWEEELLEQRYFGTSIAGEDFFRRLKEVAPDQDQLAEVYFLCLALGFKGRYRNRPEERREMQQLLYSRLPGRIARKSEALTPGVYDATVERDMTRLPMLSAARVAVVLLGAILLAFFASNVIRERIFDQLQTKAGEISAKAEQ